MVGKSWERHCLPFVKATSLAGLLRQQQGMILPKPGGVGADHGVLTEGADSPAQLQRKCALGGQKEPQ